MNVGSGAVFILFYLGIPIEPPCKLLLTFGCAK